MPFRPHTCDNTDGAVVSEQFFLIRRLFKSRRALRNNFLSDCKIWRVDLMVGKLILRSGCNYDFL